MSIISEAALIARINRNLAHDDQRLCRTRDDHVQARIDHGEYWVHDRGRNLALQTNVDPLTFARELGVLRDNEEVAY
jgi:hypothetical protein